MRWFGLAPAIEPDLLRLDEPLSNLAASLHAGVLLVSWITPLDRAWRR